MAAFLSAVAARHLFGWLVDERYLRQHIHAASIWLSEYFYLMATSRFLPIAICSLLLPHTNSIFRQYLLGICITGMTRSTPLGIASR